MKTKVFLFLLMVTYSNLSSQQKLNQDSSQILLLNAKINAETRNQEAQANYYEKQPKSTNNQWVSVLGVLVAGLIAFLSAFILANKTAQNERVKNISMQELEYIRNTKIAAADCIKKVAEGFHNLTWILWIAKHTPQRFEAKHIEIHDKKMNTLYSEIVSAQVLLSGYSKQLFLDTEGIIRNLYNYDGMVGRIAIGLYEAAKKSQAIHELGSLWSAVSDYSNKIPSEFSSKIENFSFPRVSC
jgi:outer membrane murein-binding lipoprotein Lpp